jgi:hypothetical protein
VKRTLLDALKDKVIEFVDSIDVTQILETRVKEKRLVVDTKAEDVTDRRSDPPPPA